MYLVFDIGGTKTRIATSDDGQNLAEIKIIPTQQNFAEAMKAFGETAMALTKGTEIASATGGVRGPLDQNKSMFVSNTILPQWINQPLKLKLEQALSTTVHLENDAALAGLGEAVMGAGQGFKIVAYLTISTGVGGAKIENGRIDENSLGFEPGHQIIASNQTLEQLISGSALEKKYGQKPPDISNSEVWDLVAKNLAIGINNILVTWSPDVVVLGGGVTKSIPLDKVEGYLKQIVTIFPQIPPVKKAQLGDEAVLLGALKYLKDHG